MADWQKILIAINGTDTAMKAVRYVGEMVVAVKVAKVWLLHVYPDPPPDFHVNGGTLDQYKEQMEGQGREVILKATEILKEYGFEEKQIVGDIQIANKLSISKAVIEAQKKYGCGTVVVGKRGVSKAEEFLFGSISNALARDSLGFTTWVVG